MDYGETEIQGDLDDQGFDTSELLQALKAEEQWAASYLKSELEQAQIDALQRYYGDEYGDEVEGRSRVTTREVYETIQWLRPDLRRTFCAGDKVFEFEGVTAQADQHAQAATDLINHIFLNDNEGERELDAFIFDGLLMRLGVMGCEWREPEYSPAQEVSGLSSMQVEQLMADPTTEIVGQEVMRGQPDEAHPDGLFYELSIRQRTMDGYPEVFAIAPEDFRVAARTVDLKDARYAGDIVRMMKGEAKSKWPEYAEEIDSHQGDTGGFNTDQRRAERFRDLEGWVAGSLRDGNGGEGEEIEIMREYIRHDLNGDGIAEMIRCYRLGDCLLEYDEVDEHIYSHWTPNPIPHRLFGLSVADEAKDIQRTKTVLLRSALDSVYQSVAPRMGYDNTKVTGQSLDALLTVRPGVLIGTAGNPADALFPVTVPDLSASTMNAMQWMDRVLESRTGVGRQATGMNPDLLHDTAKGEELLQNAFGIRKEEIARNLACGMQVLGMKLYRLVHKHQNQARSVKIAGAWQNIDPRAWEANMRCTVSVGLGTGAREKQLMMLQMIQGDQVAWVQAYGPGTPVVTPQHLHNLVAEKLRIMGYKSPDKFFGDPVVQNPQTGQPEPFVPQPPPNPDQMKVQAQIQEGQARLQMDGQKAQQQAAIEAEKAKRDAAIKQFEAQAKTESDARKTELDAQIERMKAEAMLEIDRQRMAAEIQMKQAQMAFEADMKERQFQFEMAMAEKEFALKERMAEKAAAAKANGKANGSGGTGVSSTHFGGDPG